MEIKELVLKNFGKFLDKSICFSSGINLIYGVNEAGKTTIHTFLKSMLFGMERSRGRGAANDTFSRYEPWYNPNYYAEESVFPVGCVISAWKEILISMRRMQYFTVKMMEKRCR